MDLNNLKFGKVIARMPFGTLVKECSPPHKLFVLEGGFLDSEIPNGAKVIKFDVSTAKDGSHLSHLDREQEQAG